MRLIIESPTFGEFKPLLQGLLSTDSRVSRYFRQAMKDAEEA